MICPKCEGPLETVRVGLHPPVIGLGVVEAVEIDVAQCVECSGVWFGRGALERYLNQRGDPLRETPMLPSRLREMDARVADCPLCARGMEKQVVRVVPEVRIDACGGCGGYWLDDGEIQRITESGSPGTVLMGDLRSRLERVLTGWLPLVRH